MQGVMRQYSLPNDIISFMSYLVMVPWQIWAIICALLFCWATAKPVKHRWRILQADKKLKMLIAIGQESGPQCQFGYLRSKSVNPYTFEEMILTALHSRKLKIRRSIRYSGDGGIDGRVWANGQLILIQAKLYSGYIKPQQVREFRSICKKQKALAIFCHSGKSGPSSRELISKDFDIVSGERMLRLLCGRTVTLFPNGIKLAV